MGRLDDRVALISGAARGQGEAEARAFVDEGASVAVADILDDEGEALAGELGEHAAFFHLDVTDEEQWSAAVAATVDRFGGLDILVNNAGILRFSAIRDTSLDDYMRIINVNQVGVFLGMRAVIPTMAERHRGSIINVSSTEGMAGLAGLVAYSSAKWAVRGLSKVGAMELGSDGIRVNTIVPGGVETPLVQSAGIDMDISGWFKQLPLGRIGKPAEIAALAVFLASDESSYCTGAEFVADGGLTAGFSVDM
ncbi:MAG TPA: glucose 1-dehydrogenase [Candidatus Dormibacteraeota bacterium]|nr:glucose 1-dehydrogenase [Candidatus Dormibacteraeota bacterium]